SPGRLRDNRGVKPFIWRDGERTIRFGRGTVETAPEELLGRDYLLLATPRTRALAPGVVEAAGGQLDVPGGRVDEIAAELLPAFREAPSGTVVALGGGRVIDTAKALAAATGRIVAAVPTTLSAAEMTWLHRHVA